MLHLDEEQKSQLDDFYSNNKAFFKCFGDARSDQEEAKKLLAQHHLDVGNLDDLGNGWSIRWNTSDEMKKGTSHRVLLQWYA